MFLFFCILKDKPSTRIEITAFISGTSNNISLKNHPIEPLKLKINDHHTVGGRNPAPFEVGSFSHYLHSFIHPNGGWEWDF